jgi:chaperone LolA
MKKIIAGLFCAVVFCGAGFAAEVDDILKRVQDADGKVKSIELNFKQTVEFNLTGERQQNEGTVKFKKPDNIRITQDDPEQHIYIDGKRITIYTPANLQAVSDKWKNAVAADNVPAWLVNIASNFKALSKENTITLESENEKDYVLRIKPNDPKNNYTLTLFIGKGTYLPTGAVLRSDAVNVVIKIYQYKLNPSFSSEDLKFKAPMGVELIEL